MTRYEPPNPIRIDFPSNAPPFPVFLTLDACEPSKHITLAHPDEPYNNWVVHSVEPIAQSTFLAELRGFGPRRNNLLR